jgi:hypothetical protein
MATRLGVMLCMAWAASCAAHTSEPGQGEAVFDPSLRIVGDVSRGRAPLSLTASDGTGLALKVLTAKVVLEPPLSFTQLELAFENPELRRLEGRFEITLPPGATVSRLALQIGDTYQEGEVVERQRARVAYEAALHRKRDPALLERDAGNQHRVRVFPIEPRERKHVIVAYSLRLDGEQEPYRLHLQGLPRVEQLRVEIDRVGSGHGARRASRSQQVFTRRQWQPTGDLLVPIEPGPANAALRAGELALVHVTPLVQSQPSSIEHLTVLLDTSASASDSLEHQVTRLRELAGAMTASDGSPLAVQLVVFDQEVVPLLQTRSDRLGDELEALLHERGARGATYLERGLHALAALPELGDRLWVFCDGIATAGRSDPASLAGAA